MTLQNIQSVSRHEQLRRNTIGVSFLYFLFKQQDELCFLIQDSSSSSSSSSSDNNKEKKDKKKEDDEKKVK